MVIIHQTAVLFKSFTLGTNVLVRRWIFRYCQLGDFQTTVFFLPLVIRSILLTETRFDLLKDIWLLDISSVILLKVEPGTR